MRNFDSPQKADNAFCNNTESDSLFLALPLMIKGEKIVVRETRIVEVGVAVQFIVDTQHYQSLFCHKK